MQTHRLGIVGSGHMGSTIDAEKAYYFNRNGLALETWNHFGVPRAEALLDECTEYPRRWE